MAKLLASSLSLERHLCALPLEEEYDLEIIGCQLIWKNVVFHGEGKGCAMCTISRDSKQRFINILRNLSDQPILLMIDDGKLWLMQCIVS